MEKIRDVFVVFLTNYVFLISEGFLDGKGLQMYAVALWKIGQYDLALSIARNLVQSISTMKQTCAAAAPGLICSLIYRISGMDSAVATIQKLPPELCRSTRMMFMLSALNALDPSNQLQLLLPSPQNVKSRDVVTEIYSIIAIGKMVRLCFPSQFCKLYAWRHCFHFQ